MVLSNQLLLGAGLVFAACAFGQSSVSSPLNVLPPAVTDPSCVKLFEQRANGNQFIAFCAANAVTTTNAITLPNSTAGGVVALPNLAQTWTAVQTFDQSVLVTGTRNLATGASPWNDFFATNHFGLTYKTCHAATTFGTCWTQQTVSGSGGGQMEFLDSGGANFLTLDGTNNRLITEGLIPKTTTTYEIGSSSARYAGGYFGFVDATGSLTVSGTSTTHQIIPATDNTYDLGGNVSFDWRQIHFQDSLVQNGTTRIDSSGNITANNLSAVGLNSNLVPTSDLGFSIGSSSFRIASFTGRTFTSYDGANSRVQILNPGSGSDSGPALTIRNNAGTALFETRYNTGVTTISELAVTGTSTLSGVIATSFTGGANASLCVNTAGLLYRGAPGC